MDKAENEFVEVVGEVIGGSTVMHGAEHPSFELGSNHVHGWKIDVGWGI